MKMATVFNTQRFSIHDGPGIRTVIFFKGCPLNCLWCANPESQRFGPELEVMPANCIGCGECQKVCPNGAIFFNETGIHVDRKKCQRCGLCARQCYSKTLKYVGKEMTVEEVFGEIMKDEVFYKNSGGGVTFSGGEPLAQGEFCLEVAKRCGRRIHTAMETCGYGDPELAVALAKELDLIFFDVKHFDPQMHKKLTGVSNELILENLWSIQDTAREIRVRTPLIAGLNDDRENIRATAELCAELKAVKEWELLPFHNLGEHKYEAIGKPYDASQFKKPDTEHLDEMIELANTILKPVGKLCRVESSGM